MKMNPIEWTIHWYATIRAYLYLFWTGRDPQECIPWVHRWGRVIGLTHSIPTRELDEWVRKIGIESGQPVDWHWMGGRALIKTLGRVAKAEATMLALRKEHDDLYIEVCKKSAYYDQRDVKVPVLAIDRS